MDRTNAIEQACVEYELSSELVQETFDHILDKSMGKLPLVDGKIPQVEEGLAPVGYENISCFHIRMTKKPKEYKGPEFEHASDSE